MSDQNFNFTFTAEDQARIEAEVQAAKDKAKQAELDAIIRNKILDEQRNMPGYKYY